MTGDVCVVCKMTRKLDKSVSMHCIPVEKSTRARWIRSLRLVEKDIKAYHRVCSRHFPLDGQSDPLDLYPVGLSADVNVIPEGNSGQGSLGVRSHLKWKFLYMQLHVVWPLVLWRRPRYTLVQLTSHFTHDTYVSRHDSTQEELRK